jgi:fatty acid desaturase
MSLHKFVSHDLTVHGYIFLRAAFLAVLFSLASFCWHLGTLFVIPAVMIYWLYCALWNTWGWAGIGHELIHNSPLKSKICNNFYLWATSILSLSNRNLFLVTHFSHHKSPHGVEDFESPYIFSDAKYKYSFVIVFGNFIDVRKFLNFFRYLFLNSLGIIPAPKLVAFLIKRKRFDVVILNARIIFFYVMLILIGSLLLESIWPIFALLIPNFLATGLVKSLTLLQHPTYDLMRAAGIKKIEFKGNLFPISNFDSEFLRDKLDMRIPRWLSFFYANMNYHASHHNRMIVSFFQLPKESVRNVQDGRVGIVSIGNLQILKFFFQSR